MMLHALYELAKREKLIEDPDYEKRPVDYFIVIGADGSFHSLIPLQDERGKALHKSVPRQPKRSVGIIPGFLIDNAKYVLGISAPEKSNPERDEKCAAAFAEIVDSLATQTHDDGALAIARFLKRRQELLPAIFQSRAREKWTGSEWLTFVLDSNVNQPVFEREAVRSYWARLRANEGDNGEAKVRCLVTGKMAAATRLHNSVKRVPGAQIGGASLVSFNAPAFESHGFSQGANAPVSRLAAEGYVTALNWLLEGSARRPFQYGVRLGPDAVMVFWSKEHDPLADILVSFFDPDPEQLRNVLESPFTGINPGASDESAFYALGLSGNAARVVVRDWMENTVGEVKRNVARYFTDLHIGNGPVRVMPMHRLLSSLQTPSGIGLAPELATKLLHAAIRGSPFPRELLAGALRRLRLPPKENDPRYILNARCSLIKATLLRLPRSGLTPLEVTVSLDEANVSVPYLLGRLFAVLEKLQEAALPGVNATIRDRYFGAAMAHPSAVFPRLLTLSNHHSSKAENSGWLEQLKGRVIGALPAKKFPQVLSMEDQGLFAIGYYHQREHFFAKRASSTPIPTP
jgi:CRISPR-associated protein Csd1